MGRVVEIISGKITNQTTLTAWTMATGDTLTIRDTPETAPILLGNAWCSSATAGKLRIRSPRMHDNVANLDFRIGAAVIRNLFGDYPETPLYPQDLLTVQQLGGGAETDNGFLEIEYSDVTALAAQLFSWEQIRPRIKNLLSVEVAPVTSGTAGDWGTGRAINADNDNFKADTAYALLGFVVDTAVGCIAFRGVDTGNLRIGAPGPKEPLETREWFIRQSLRTGRPYIPVFKAANKGNFLVFACDPATTATIQTDVLLAELS